MGKSLRSKRAKEKENHPIISVMTASIAQGNGTYLDERGLTRKNTYANVAKCENTLLDDCTCKKGHIVKDNMLQNRKSKYGFSMLSEDTKHRLATWDENRVHADHRSRLSVRHRHYFPDECAITLGKARLQ